MKKEKNRSKIKGEFAKKEKSHFSQKMMKIEEEIHRIFLDTSGRPKITPRHESAIQIMLEEHFSPTQVRTGLEKLEKNGILAVKKIEIEDVGKARFFFLKELTNHRQDIPKEIFTEHNFKIAFIQGIMDADGWITKVNASDGYIRYRVAFNNTSLWTSTVREMIRELGVKTGRLRKLPNYRKGIRNKDSFQFSINAKDYCKKIGFRISRKNQLVQECLNFYHVNS